MLTHPAASDPLTITPACPNVSAAKRVCSCPIDAHQLHCIVCKTGGRHRPASFRARQVHGRLGAHTRAPKSTPSKPSQAYHESPTTLNPPPPPVPPTTPFHPLSALFIWSAPPLPRRQVWGRPRNVKTTGGLGGRLQAGWSPKSLFLCPLLGIPLFSGRLLGCSRDAAGPGEGRGPHQNLCFASGSSPRTGAPGTGKKFCERQRPSLSPPGRVPVTTCPTDLQSPLCVICTLAVSNPYHFSTCTKGMWA